MRFVTSLGHETAPKGVLRNSLQKECLKPRIVVVVLPWPPDGAPGRAWMGPKPPIRGHGGLVSPHAERGWHHKYSPRLPGGAAWVPRNGGQSDGVVLASPDAGHSFVT